MAEVRIPIEKYGGLTCPWYHGSRLSVCHQCHFFKGTGGAFGKGTWVACVWNKAEAAELDKKAKEAAELDKKAKEAAELDKKAKEAAQQKRKEEVARQKRLEREEQHGS